MGKMLRAEYNPLVVIIGIGDMVLGHWREGISLGIGFSRAVLETEVKAGEV